jgi:hypothetical protein
MAPTVLTRLPWGHRGSTRVGQTLPNPSSWSSSYPQSPKNGRLLWGNR